MPALPDIPAEPPFWFLLPVSSPLDEQPVQKAVVPNKVMAVLAQNKPCFIASHSSRTGQSMSAYSPDRVMREPRVSLRRA